MHLFPAPQICKKNLKVVASLGHLLPELLFPLSQCFASLLDLKSSDWHTGLLKAIGQTGTADYEAIAVAPYFPYGRHSTPTRFFSGEAQGWEIF